MVMGWSKVHLAIGKTGAGDTLSTAWFSPGVIKEATTTMEVAAGDTQEMKATGGIVVAKLQKESTATIKTRVIEMPLTTLNVLLPSTYTAAVANAEAGSGGDRLDIKSFVTTDEYSIRIFADIPGGVGVECVKCQTSVVPGRSEEEGNYYDITFTVLKPSGSDKLVSYLSTRPEDIAWADSQTAPAAPTGDAGQG